MKAGMIPPIIQAKTGMAARGDRCGRVKRFLLPSIVHRATDPCRLLVKETVQGLEGMQAFMALKEKNT